MSWFEHEYKQRTGLTPAQARMLETLPGYVSGRSRVAAALVELGLARWLKKDGKFRKGMTITPAGREALTRAHQRDRAQPRHSDGC